MKLLILIIVLLAMLVIWMAIRLHVQKNQVRSFAKQVNEIRESGHEKLITVDTFAKDYVNLANELNSYVEMEKELLEKAKEDRQSVKMMVAGISHDFRTPLTAAMGYMQMVRRSPEITEKNGEYLDIAIDKTKYLKDLSDEFFELSLVGNGKREEDIKLVSLKRILENVTLAQYNWIQERGIDFTADITDDACEMKAVEVDILRLFENLYSNAKKYANKIIKVKLSKDEEGIHFSIVNDMSETNALTDELSSENVEEVFQPFHRASSAGVPGNGLGLYITKLIVESYGGEIEAKLDGEDTFEIKARL